MSVFIEIYRHIKVGNRESDVMKMHCELLRDKFTEESVTASVGELIKSMVGGKVAYRASALKLALRSNRFLGSAPLPRGPSPGSAPLPSTTGVVFVDAEEEDDDMGFGLFD